MSDIRHIVFDVGQVLLHYDPHLAFLELIPERDERDEFFADVCTHDWNLEQDRGRSWAEAEAEAIARHPDKAELIRAFRRNHSLMIPHAIEETVTIFETLIAGGHDVTLLTNFAADTFAEQQERYPFLKKSRGVTVSGEIGVMKPAPEIFALHVKTFALNPEATLFFDDNAANIEAARKRGWRAEIYESPEQIRRDLERYGVML